MRIMSADELQRFLPRRLRQSHKGNFGHVLLIGGAPGMPGAVRLAGVAALRAGAGRGSIATHSAHATMIPAGRPELMCHAVENAAELEPLFESANIVAIGPGLGRGAWSARLYAAALASGKPLVMDADALNLLAEKPQSREACVLTPHPGEAASLLGCKVHDVQSDRLRALAKLRQRFGGTVVLKGCGTLVSSHAMPWLCLAGNPGMASPGMGDILTGVIAGLMAQGLNGEMAAVVGVDVHARAADVAATAGERGLLASDVLQELRPWVNP
jgi:NAD(P)H-hydrate epimerase